MIKENDLISSGAAQFQEEKKKNYNKDRTNKYALGYRSPIIEEALIPKIDPDKVYRFSSVNYSKDPIDSTRSRLKNDHISLRPYKPFLSVEKVEKIRNKVIKIDGSYTSNSAWNCQNSSTINNLSGAAYNIINFEEDYVSKKHSPRLLDYKTCNKKKSISEFNDLTGPNSLRFNPYFKKSIDNNKNIFNKVTGVFTHMYDSSCRNGNISVPFHRSGINIIEPVESTQARHPRKLLPI